MSCKDLRDLKFAAELCRFFVRNADENSDPQTLYCQWLLEAERAWRKHCDHCEACKEYRMSARSAAQAPGA